MEDLVGLDFFWGNNFVCCLVIGEDVEIGGVDWEYLFFKI